MFHSQRYSYIRTDDPSTKAMARRAFTVSWNVEVFVHSRSVVIFPPGAPVTSFLSQQISTVIRSPRFQQDETSWALSSIAVVSKAIKRTARTSLSHLKNSHNAVSRHLDKNRAKHRRTVFSMKKAQKSKQRSTNWRRRHLGDMQQQPRRWPGFDKRVKTKLRWDVYIRPWPPGWSFWRRIYTSRGSERVKVGSEQMVDKKEWEKTTKGSAKRQKSYNNKKKNKTRDFQKEDRQTNTALLSKIKPAYDQVHVRFALVLLMILQTHFSN